MSAFSSEPCPARVVPDTWARPGRQLQSQCTSGIGQASLARENVVCPRLFLTCCVRQRKCEADPLSLLRSCPLSFFAEPAPDAASYRERRIEPEFSYLTSGVS